MDQKTYSPDIHQSELSNKQIDEVKARAGYRQRSAFAFNELHT